MPGTRETTRELGSVLGRLNKTLGLARPDTVRLLDEHWPALVGTGLASKCQVDSVRHGELVVAVQDVAVAEHLRWSGPDLIAAANSVCGAEVLTKLVVRMRDAPA